ncbi:MAG: ABC transporter ATP-binding protein [Rhodospirillales bacterium]|nr:ABC transporter ATP-binding protein/permease [Rhodospirillales bacterium]MDE2199269.1 ABC transporter ATP-binding protein [Rhodospirillales bacterium]MDE2575444.1 ABC transporter ATP-binding protein [Rhodospirillales bacterium]
MEAAPHQGPHALTSPSALPRYQARPLAFILRYVRRHAAAHIGILGSVLLAVICAVGTQYGMKTLIDVVSRGPQAGGTAVWWAFALLCLLITADNLSWRIGGWIAASAFVRVTGDVRRDLFAHLAGHAPSYFSERLPGTLASRITATSNAVFMAENSTAWNVLPPCIGVVVAIALVASVNPLMAASLAAVSFAMAAYIFHLARRGTPIHRDFATKAAGVDGELVDVIGNMHVVRAFGATWREHDRLGARIEVEMKARRRSLIYLEKLRLIHALITVFITAGLLAWGVRMWQNGQATPGDMVLITSLGLTILHSTRDLAVALVDLTQHIARLDEAITAILVPHDLPDAPDAPPLRHGPGQVSFDAVRFAYPGRPPILNGLDLRIEPGQRVGLVGASGAGKSTVLALLQRFYDVQHGAVRIDGQDISTVTQESLRAMLAVVPQDISLFHRSVLENIRYARPEASEAEVLTAAEIARCRDFIEALPDGFATMVGDRGVKLSGGQRQRLAIARALLKNAPILLLDEATSALDSESEQAIQLALDNLMRGRTVIAIAHRLSTLRNFDRIVVMEAGRVIDDGAPDTLAARPGPYRDLLRAQMAGNTQTAA